MSQLAAFEAMLARGQDSALLRFTLGKAYYDGGDLARAIEHLQSAVAQDAQHSASWKLLGRALLDSGDAPAAADVLMQGIAVASARGDKQAEKEMQVFLRRAQKQLGGDA
jgi:predicted Zn-dependent protease